MDWVINFNSSFFTFKFKWTPNIFSYFHYDFKLINSVRKPTIYLSVLTFLLPALAGFAVYFNFVPDDLPGQLLYASLFASHSVGIVFPVIRDLKLAKTKFGAAVLISTVITDIGSIILLAGKYLSSGDADCIIYP